MKKEEYYENNPIKVENIEEWVYDVVNQIPKSAKKILDVGCGEGSYSAILKNAGFEVWGFEISETAGEIARTKIDGVIIQDTEKEWEIPPNSFDVTVFLRYLEHVFDYDFQLKQAHKALKKDGCIVIFSPSWSILEKMRLLLGLIPKCLTFEHIRQFNKPILFKILEENGFHPIHCEGYGFRIPKIGFRLKFMEKLFPNSCPCLIIKAVKK